MNSLLPYVALTRTRVIVSHIETGQSMRHPTTDAFTVNEASLRLLIEIARKPQNMPK